MSEGLIEALRRVQGAVSKNDIVETLTHVIVHDRHAYAHDGRIVLRAPCPDAPSSLSFACRATPVYRALDAAPDVLGTPTMVHDAQGSTLTLRKGKMRIVLNTSPVDVASLLVPSRTPGRVVTEGAALARSLRALAPFVTEDASRPWANGIWVQGPCALATNNVVLVRARLDAHLPAFNLPFYAIEEFCTMVEQPGTRLKVVDGCLELVARDGVWMRTRLIDGEWPRSPGELLKEAHEKAKCVTVPPQVLQAAEYVLPFCPDNKVPIIRFDHATVCTDAGVTSAQVEKLMHEKCLIDLGTCRFRAEPLIDVLRIATRADFTKFPRVPFEGEGLDGIIMGMML